MGSVHVLCLRRQDRERVQDFSRTSRRRGWRWGTWGTVGSRTCRPESGPAPSPPRVSLQPWGQWHEAQGVWHEAQGVWLGASASASAWCLWASGGVGVLTFAPECDHSRQAGLCRCDSVKGLGVGDCPDRLEHTQSHCKCPWWGRGGSDGGDHAVALPGAWPHPLHGLAAWGSPSGSVELGPQFPCLQRLSAADAAGVSWGRVLPSMQRGRAVRALVTSFPGTLSVAGQAVLKRLHGRAGSGGEGEGRNTGPASGGPGADPESLPARPLLRGSGHGLCRWGSGLESGLGWLPAPPGAWGRALMSSTLHCCRDVHEALRPSPCVQDICRPRGGPSGSVVPRQLSAP